MSKVLVTGASGFIGRHLVARLRAGGHEIIAAGRDSGDVADPATWKRFPRAAVVVHLAAKSFVPESWDAPSTFVRVNLAGTVEALEYCRAHGARFVFPSSYLYGDVVRQPIAESTPLVATNPYALSKKMAEEACEFYVERFGLQAVMLRPFNIYGPGQADTFLIPTILRQLTAGKEIRVKDLEPRRDYVHVDDVVELMTVAVERQDAGGVFNVGSGTSCSVSELIQTMQEVWGTNLPVHSDRVRRDGEIMDTVADISRARQLLGWQPRWTLRQGLEALRDGR